MEIVLIDAQTGKERDITELVNPICPVRIYESYGECFPFGSSITYSHDNGATWNGVHFGRIARAASSSSFDTPDAPADPAHRQSDNPL